LKSKDKDFRFNIKSFRDAARYVLMDIGLKPTYTNFLALDSIMNWIEIYRNRNAYYAVCHIMGKEVLYDTRISLRIEAASREEALSKIDTKVYSFIEWW